MYDDIFFTAGDFYFIYIPFSSQKKILKTIEWIQSSMYKFNRQILKIRMKTHVSRELLFISESRDRENILLQEFFSSS